MFNTQSQQLLKRVAMQHYEKIQKELRITCIEKVEQIFTNYGKRIPDNIIEELRKIINELNLCHPEVHEDQNSENSLLLSRELLTFLVRYAKYVARKVKSQTEPEIFLLHYFNESEHYFNSNIHFNKILVGDTCQQNTCPLVMISRLHWKIWVDHVFTPLKEIIADALVKLYEKLRQFEGIEMFYDAVALHTGVIIDKFMDHVRTLFLHYSSAKPVVREFLKDFRDKLFGKVKIFYEERKSVILKEITLDKYAEFIKMVLGKERGLFVYCLKLGGIVAKKWDKLFDTTFNPNYIEAFHNEFKRLLTTNDVNQLMRIFFFLKDSFKNLSNFENIFKEHILEELRHTFKRSYNLLQSAETIFNVYEKYRFSLWVAFKDLPNFNAALESAILKVFIENSARMECSRGDIKMLSDVCFMYHPPRVHLQKVMLMYTLLPDKNEFKKIFIETIANRDVDELTLLRLKNILEFNYKTDLLKIIEDYVESRKINILFKRQLFIESGFTKPVIELNVQIFSSHLSPFKPENRSFYPPPLMNFFISKFYEYYRPFYPKRRKLYWLFEKSIGQIELTLCTGQYKIIANTFQMAVLLQFNDANIFTMQELKVITRLEEDHLFATVGSILKAKILTCTNPQGILAKDSVIKFCSLFESRQENINISVLQEELKEEPSPRDPKLIEEDRTALIEAAIVRIMKKNKTMDSRAIKNVLKKDLGSRIGGRDINLENYISKLIKMEYIRSETEEGTSLYHYIP